MFSRIRTEHGEVLRSSLYSVRMRENRDQKSCECGHYSLSDYFCYGCSSFFILQPNHPLAKPMNHKIEILLLPSNWRFIIKAEFLFQCNVLSSKLGFIVKREFYHQINCLSRDSPLKLSFSIKVETN